MDLSVEAKREYLAMLCSVMAPIMSETFVDMYKEAVQRSNRHRDHVAKMFTVLLEEVENWNNSIIKTHVDAYEAKCHYFTDLLAAVFVCYIKILSSIRINKEPKKLPIKLPSNADFVHSCLIRAADKFKTHVHIFREENALKKEQELVGICAKSIEETLNKLIPIQQILRTYITDTSSFDLNDEMPEEEEQEVPPIDEFAGAAEAKVEGEEQPVEEPQGEPEVKEIGLRPVESPNLFDDAAEKISKPNVDERTP
jgi:hypothetical protein